MNIINFFWNNWLVLAFVAPLFWALVNIIDIFLVNQVYEDEYDGAIMIGFFQIIPWLAVPFFGFSLPEGGIALFAMLGGILYCASMLFYFRALFATNDASFILVFWNMTALTVPILAFLIFKERLSIVQYAGIAITFLGVLFLTLNKKVGRGSIKKVATVMSCAVLFFSLSMVVQDGVYSNTAFWGGFLFFSLGNILGSIIIFSLRKKKTASHLLRLNKKYFSWFLMTELVSLTGVISSQRSIDLSPSVSFVAAIESIQPAFIMILSAVIFAAFAIFSLGNKKMMKKIYEEQLVGFCAKSLAIIIVAIGIYMINL